MCLPRKIEWSARFLGIEIVAKIHTSPSRQDAATLWYHDHAMGINRLNVYAGLDGLFLVRDEVEDALSLPAGRYDIPLLLCDRMFDQPLVRVWIENGRAERVKGAVDFSPSISRDGRSLAAGVAPRRRDAPTPLEPGAPGAAAGSTC